MVASTVIAQPSDQLERVRSTGRDRCACCGGPTLPVLEWRGDHAVCYRCARFCEAKGRQYKHVSPARIDRAAADRVWAIDLGFKQLGQ